MINASISHQGYIKQVFCLIWSILTTRMIILLEKTLKWFKSYHNSCTDVRWTYQDAVKSRRGASSLHVPQDCHSRVEPQTLDNKLGEVDKMHMFKQRSWQCCSSSRKHYCKFNYWFWFMSMILIHVMQISRDKARSRVTCTYSTSAVERNWETCNHPHQTDTQHTNTTETLKKRGNSKAQASHSNFSVMLVVELPACSE